MESIGKLFFSFYTTNEILQTRIVVVRIDSKSDVSNERQNEVCRERSKLVTDAKINIWDRV